MGKHFWTKHLDQRSHDKQPSCIWGLVHVLDYHTRHSNTRSVTQHHRYEGSEDYPSDEGEPILDGEKRSYLQRTGNTTKKQTVKAQVKGSMVDETSKNSDSVEGKGDLNFKKKLRRTYSIHHRESLNVDSKGSLIFVPGNVESNETRQLDTSETIINKEGERRKSSSENTAKPHSEENTVVLEISKVDKGLLIKNQQDADAGIASFSHSALGLDMKAKLSKSRSFPLAELSKGRELKPIKLESKQNEVWSIRREERKSAEENEIKKCVYRRSSSLNESLDKYARLFQNSSFPLDAKFGPSMSLKVANKYSNASEYFRRARSLSNVDVYISNPKLEESSNDLSRNGATVTATTQQYGEDENFVVQPTDDGGNVASNIDIIPADAFDETQVNDEESKFLFQSNDINKKEVDITPTELSYLVIHLQETDYHHSSEIPAFEGIDDINFSSGFEDTTSHQVENLDSNSTSDDTDTNFVYECSSKMDDYDLSYVRRLLDESGIALDASDMTWHTRDQLLGPTLFEKVEASFPHQEDELTGWQDFYGCWHHKMLFDLVNEVILEVYDLSLPYYPTALSSSCHVRPFPMGNRIVEEVSASINTMLNLKPKDERSPDSIVARDLGSDCGWMNLQVETECTGIELEDMIFSDLLEEELLFDETMMTRNSPGQALCRVFAWSKPSTIMTSC